MTVILILLILIIVLLLVKLRQLERQNYAPGPFPWPWIGNLFYLRKLTRKFGAQHLAFEELSNRYRSKVISLQLGTTYMLVVNDPELMHILMNKEEYNARPWNRLAELRNMGMKKGLTMNEGTEHKDLRAWTVRVMRDVGFGQRLMTEFLLNELRSILDRLKEGGVRYMKPLIAPATINTVWSLIAGKQLFDNDAKLQAFLSLIARRSKLFDVSGGILSACPWLCYVAPNMTGYKILTELNEKLKKILMDTINEHKERYCEGSEADFIDMFLREMSRHDSDSSVFQDENLLVTLIDFFIAGIGTTTPILEFLFLEMANHQDAQRELHEEIDRVIGSDRFPDPSDRSRMHYAEAVITECIRKWMIIPVINRRTLEDTTVKGYRVPQNTTVMFNVASNNHDASLYPDPLSFKPERFLKDGVFQPDKNLIPFGKGKRRCPGDVLAKWATFLFFVGVMQKYRLLPPNNEHSIKIDVNIGLTINPKPYEMLVVPR